MEKKKILLIDDEKDLCELIKLNLESGGEYAVEIANSGEEGVKKVKEGSFDLVITDFRMPGMDGEDVLAALKSMNVEPPVILFSIYHDDDSTITGKIRSMADGLISKPIDHEHLNKVIREVLAKKKKNNKGD
ncbi:MAG: response regulator [Pseudomonadota bacterium]